MHFSGKKCHSTLLRGWLWGSGCSICYHLPLFATIRTFRTIRYLLFDPFGFSRHPRYSYKIYSSGLKLYWCRQRLVTVKQLTEFSSNTSGEHKIYLCSQNNSGQFCYKARFMWGHVAAFVASHINEEWKGRKPAFFRYNENFILWHVFQPRSQPAKRPWKRGCVVYSPAYYRKCVKRELTV